MYDIVTAFWTPSPRSLSMSMSMPMSMPMTQQLGDQEPTDLRKMGNFREIDGTL
jgi:hypothetical protein